MPTATNTGTCYETTLHVDLGDNPHRPRPGRDWLANPYRIHQRIMWALDGQSAENRPLFRIYRDRVMVRTTTPPNWQQAFLTPPHAAPFLLLNSRIPEAQPQVKELHEGACYWFDILFCPPHHTPPGRVIGKTNCGKPKRERGKRIGKVVRDDEGRVDEQATRAKQLEGFVKHLANTGLEPASANSIFVMDRFLLRASKGQWSDVRETHGPTRSGRKRRVPVMQAHVALITGQLRVADPEAAFRTLLNGIGPAKGLGCGMLILGNPVQNHPEETHAHPS